MLAQRIQLQVICLNGCILYAKNPQTDQPIPTRRPNVFRDYRNTIPISLSQYWSYVFDGVKFKGLALLSGKAA